MFGYGLPSLTADQLALRRQQLDNAGFHAWLSSLCLVLLALLWRLASRAFAISNDPKLSQGVPSAIQLLSRRASWLLNTTYSSEFGPLSVQLTGLAYLVWLLFIITRNAGDDYMHLTKAFGHVAVSQLPLHYLLSMKAPTSPITLATGLTHERLNAYHRLFGRIIHGLLGTHAILYIRFFILNDLMAKRIQDRDVRLGLIAFWLFNFLGLLAIPPIRKHVYHKIFYRSHVVISALVLPVLFFHVPYSRRYVAQAAVFWVANGYLRKSSSTKTTVACQGIKGTDLIRVTLHPENSSWITTWTPGEHVYLNQAGIGPKNPFTIVSVSAIDASEHIELIVRHLGGRQTDALATLASDKSKTTMTLEGPYGEASKYMPSLLQNPKTGGQFLLIAGGIGATYTLPIYLALLKSQGDLHGLRMIWFVKSYSDAAWGLEALRNASQTVSVDIYVTQPSQTDTEQRPDTKGITINHIGSRPVLSLILDPIMNLRSDSTNGGDLFGSRSLDPRRMKRNYEKVTVFLCGPPGLASGVRKEVGKHATGYGREVAWYEEQFGHGGS